MSVGAICLALGVLAFVHDGVPAAEVELNDGGVWVTNGSKLLVGHLNVESQTLDGGLRAAAPRFDVTQFGTDVLFASPDLIQPLDTASVSFVGESTVTGITKSHGGSTVLFADPVKGKVWATDMAGAGGFNVAASPLLDDLDAPLLATSITGRGFVVTRDGSVRRVTGTGSETTVEEAGSLGELSPDAVLTTVGETLLALDGNRILTTDRQIEVDGLASGVLQQASPAADEVVVADATGLWRIPLAGGTPRHTDVPSGEPAAPVLLDGCAYGLWARSGYYVRDCGDPNLDQAAQFQEIASSKEPVFRVNRKVIVINDMASGATYLPLESMLRVDNWDLIANQLKQEEQDKESQESDESELSQLQEFSDEQHPPVANDDEFGARAGTATTLPVLLNDTDDDGDVLTVVFKDVPPDVSLALAKDGRAARLEVPPGKVGTINFSYQAFDGSDLSNVAQVRVAVRQPGANDAPERIRRNSIQLAERSTAEYAVLPDWVDPDGDPMFLANAVSEEGLSVTWRPDGFVSVKDLGTGGPGRRVVSITVSDGTLSTTEELTVMVTPGASNSPPVANNDHIVASVGEPITIRPTANDTDPDADDLRLVELGPTAPEVTAKPDFNDNSIQFTATKAGSHTLVYSISDGPNKAKGKIRVDVIDPEEAPDVPAAENDLALLPANGSVVVEPLRNDFDPAGGVLVIQGVSMGSAKGLNVEVIRHSLLRVTAPAGLKEPQTFAYTISNGKASATAKVLVVPLTVQSQVQAPVALPETTLVRAGDIVSVDVLVNDYSPSDLAIKLTDQLDVRSEPALGEFFLSGDQVRFRAGGSAGQAEAIYTIADEEGNVASTTVTVNIKDFESANQNPAPKPVEARTFAGREVLIAIPMDGVDPDGDSVELLGTGTKPPLYGSVTVEGNYLKYAASPTSTGTDVFNYKVKDRFGSEGEGLVRVGIAPTPTENQAPVAVPDEIAARPNTKLEIPAVANDIDPDGDALSLVADSVEPVDDRWAPQASIEGQKIVVTTPEAKGIYQLYYRITDGGGAPVTGVITVIVNENVPPVAPIARDDYVAANALAGLDAAEVDVLTNDSDPDGVVADLVVTVDTPATVENGKVTVPLTDDRQIVLYTITDADGLSARAAVVVPGKNQVAPYLDKTKIPATVKGGETLTIDFDSFIITRDGHTSKLTAVDSVVAGPGGNTKDPQLGLKVASDKVVTFTPDVLFYGETSVSFQVTDGETLDDPRGLKATLTVPITVTTSGLFPPVLRPSEIKVARGEDPIDVSLAAMVDDPDEGDNAKMAYTIVSATAPLDAAIKGQGIAVSVPADTPVGTTGSIVVKVHDGSTEPLEMTVPVTVIESSRPLMIVTDITENEGRVGKPLTFNLADVVTNPFADKGGEVTLVGAPSTTGPATVSANGLVLTVTPTDSGSASDVAEDVVVSYTVADATRDSSRYRTGVIRVVVKDIPKAPTNVTADAVKSKTARVTWVHSGWRGGQPKGFTVTWAGGSKDCGLQTSCDIDTLPNNNTYTFTVTARVAEADIAESAPSVASNAIFVDVIPNVPAAPVAKFGDKQIDLTWPTTAVPDGGSPVTSYTVDIMPADASGRTQQTVTGTTFTWPNLVNGTAYTFKVTAHNELTKRDSRVTAPQGPASAAEIPAGAPSQQGAPTVAKDKAAVGVAPRATVTWGAPGNPNGDSSFTYELRQTGSTTVLYSGSATSTVITMAVGTEDKTFEVRSTNKSALWSDWSPASNAVRAFQPPGAPTGFTLAPTGDGTRATFTFGPAAGNGAKPGEISYRWNAGGTSGTVVSGQTVNSSAFPLGTTVTVRLTAISMVNGETAEGESVTATVNTYAPPAAPGVSANQNGSGNVDLHWNMSGSSNGRPITAVQLSTTDNPNGGDVGLSGTRTEGSGPFQEKCITVRSRNSEGQTSTAVTACATTRGKGTATQTHGSTYGTCPFDANQQCDKVNIELSGWYPGAGVTCTYDVGDPRPVLTAYVNGSGNWGPGLWGTSSWYGLIAKGYLTSPQNVSGACHYS